MGIFTDIREFFWPLLEPETKPIIRKTKHKAALSEITLTKELDLDVAYDLAMKFYEAEREREKSVEAKSTVFIACIGFGITIILNLGKDFIFTNGDMKMVSLVFVFLFAVITLYLVRTVWFAIQALQRKTYHKLGPADFIIERDSGYKKHLIDTLINYTQKNAVVNNDKVDQMTMAQEYFKRAVVAMGLYAGLLLIVAILKTLGKFGQ